MKCVILYASEERQEMSVWVVVEGARASARHCSGYIQIRLLLVNKSEVLIKTTRNPVVYK